MKTRADEMKPLKNMGWPDCGCTYTIDDDGVWMCPLHAAAPELLGGIYALRDRLQMGDDNTGDKRNRNEIALCNRLIEIAEKGN